jgi:excisionase family DNA binding protein
MITDASTPERIAVDAATAARKLGASVSFIYKLVKTGQLDGYAIGRRKIIYLDSLDAYRQRNNLRTLAAARQTATPVVAPEPEPRRAPRRTRRPATPPAGRHLR